jgi:hypothetical protein
MSFAHERNFVVVASKHLDGLNHAALQGEEDIVEVLEWHLLKCLLKSSNQLVNRITAFLPLQ